MDGQDHRSGRAAAWRRFRDLPRWAQALLWLAAWPALGALLAADARRLGGAARPVAVGVLLLGGLLWWGGPLLSGDGEEGGRVARTAPADEEGRAQTAPTPTPRPDATADVGDPPTAAPTASPTPDPEPAGTAALASTAEGDLEIHFIDVGQGDATLLRTADVAVLVDAGRHVASEVVSYLRSVGVDRLDVVAVTHPHADHIGQFDQVMSAFPVAEVWWSGTTHTTQTFARAVAALEASQAAYEEPRAGDTTTVGGLGFEFLNPSPAADRRDLHDSSLAFRVTWGGVRVLFTGDAESATEQRMAADHADRLDVDLYQVGHHGSSTSTSPSLLAAASPEVAVYSAGAGNAYGHPHAEVVERLTRAGVELYGTDVHGTVVITTDGTTWAVDTRRSGRIAVADVAPAQPRAPPAEPASDQPVEQPVSASSGCAPGQVDINSAGIEELQRIKHIGPERAQQIVALRPFASVDALVRVDGIAAGRLADIEEEGIACG